MSWPIYTIRTRAMVPMNFFKTAKSVIKGVKKDRSAIHRRISLQNKILLNISHLPYTSDSQ